MEDGKSSKALTLGGRIKEARELRKMSRHDLAGATGIPYSTIAEIENDRQKSSTKIDLIATALDTTPKFLRTGRPDRTSTIDPSPAELRLRPREMELIETFRDLTEASKKKLEGYIDGLPRRSGKRASPVRRSEGETTSARNRRSG